MACRMDGFPENRPSRAHRCRAAIRCRQRFVTASTSSTRWTTATRVRCRAAMGLWTATTSRRSWCSPGPTGPTCTGPGLGTDRSSHGLRRWEARRSRSTVIRSAIRVLATRGGCAAPNPRASRSALHPTACPASSSRTGRTSRGFRRQRTDGECASTSATSDRVRSSQRRFRCSPLRSSRMCPTATCLRQWAQTSTGGASTFPTSSGSRMRRLRCAGSRRQASTPQS